MLIFFRIALPLALAFGLTAAARNARLHPETGDLMNAFWLAYCVLVGIATAIVWAPVVADRMADPLTGVVPDSTYKEPPNRLRRLIRWLDGRAVRRWARWLCFIDGIRHPWSPAPFILGLRNSEPGSWLELVYAREVFKFNNAENCLRAYEILRRRGQAPKFHRNKEVTLLMSALEKTAEPEAAPLPVPPAEAPPLERNPRIKLPSKLTAPPDAVPPAPPPLED